MDWRERAALMAEARAEVHDSFKIPVMFSIDRASWRAVFCRFHEAVNAEGQDAGPGANLNISVDTDTPLAIFRHSDVPDLTIGALVSVAPGVAYSISQAAPADRHGYRTARLKRLLGEHSHPAPDWGVA